MTSLRARVTFWYVGLLTVSLLVFGACIYFGVQRYLETSMERSLASEAKSIAERKKHLVSLLADVATVGAERMSEKIGKASLRDAAIGTGIAVDKILALTGQTPAVQVAVVLPTAEERAERTRAHCALDEIARKLRLREPV